MDSSTLTAGAWRENMNHKDINHMKTNQPRKFMGIKQKKNPTKQAEIKQREKIKRLKPKKVQRSC